MQKIIAALAAVAFTASASQLLTQGDIDALNHELMNQTGYWMDDVTYFEAMFVQREGTSISLIHGLEVASDFMGDSWVQAQHQKLLPFAEHICNEPMMVMEARFTDVQSTAVYWIYLFDDQPAMFEYQCEDLRSRF